MTFTYNLASGDANILAVSKVRLEIGDITANAGVRPDRSNFTDEEILHWLNEEDGDVMRASARACAALASSWSLVANETIGPRKFEFGKIADGWQKRADALNDQYGRGIAYVL